MSSSVSISGGGGGDAAGHVPRVVRPNFFVAVQISNNEIHKNIIRVQKALIKFDQALAKALVDVATSHVTLLLARIDDENTLSLARSALNDFYKEFGKDWKSLKLTFSGLDHFSNKVLYARVVKDENHRQFLHTAYTLRRVFERKGINLINNTLHPHLTIAKMSKIPPSWEGEPSSGPEEIEPQSYATYKDLYFGDQTISGLQLLAMNRPKDAKRYFYCCEEIRFENFLHNYDDDDHSQCCFPPRSFNFNVNSQ